MDVQARERSQEPSKAVDEAFLDETEMFYASVPIFDDFARLMDPGLYRPLPDDWTIGIADIVDSTSAIAAEKYKSVNLAGAAVIASVTNALHDIEFPFVFGGDGASFAVSPAQLEAARTALSATADWVRRELELSLRVGLIPVTVIRERGLDVRVARHAPSSDVSYAMFTGGGLAWAEAALKRGEFAVTPLENGHPDLSGLSCRFDEVPSSRGLILSLIVQQVAGVDPAHFRKEIDRILALVEHSPGAGHPLSAGLTMTWPPQGLGLEASAMKGGPRIFKKATLLGRTLLDRVLTKVGAGKTPEDVELRKKAIVDNSDFRKFDDGLRMILDCDPASSGNC